MNHEAIANALAVHCAVMAVLHAALLALLYQRGKFNWMTSGFWVWSICVVIFVLHPLVALAGNNLGLYADRLATTDGVSRVYWVMIVIAAGEVAYFAAYLFAAEPRPLNVPDLPVTKPIIVTLAAFVGLAFFSIVKYRMGARMFDSGAVGLDGKFTGSVTGWETSMHRFALFPMAYLWFSKRTRLWGLALLAVYTAVRLFDPDERITVVTPFLALSFVLLAERGRKWPPAWSLAVMAAVPVLLVLRGHEGMAEFDLGTAVEEAPRHVVDLASGLDTDMLAQFYKQSAVHDEHGYTYGLTFVESALFGYLPRKYFPWKDQLFDCVVFNPYNHPRWSRFIFGPKSSLIGYYYFYGSIVAVLICCPLTGYLGRKLDGMVSPRQPRIIRSLGVQYMAMAFMFFMSAPEWDLQYVVVIALPWLAAVGVGKLCGLEAHLSSRGPEGRRPVIRTSAARVPAARVPAARVPAGESPSDRFPRMRQPAVAGAAMQGWRA